MLRLWRAVVVCVLFVFVFMLVALALISGVYTNRFSGPTNSNDKECQSQNGTISIIELNPSSIVQTSDYLSLQDWPQVLQRTLLTRIHQDNLFSSFVNRTKCLLHASTCNAQIYSPKMNHIHLKIGDLFFTLDLLLKCFLHFMKIFQKQKGNFHLIHRLAAKLLRPSIKFNSFTFIFC